jgi:hypothetical protein
MRARLAWLMNVPLLVTVILVLLTFVLFGPVYAA